VCFLVLSMLVAMALCFLLNVCTMYVYLHRAKVKPAGWSVDGIVVLIDGDACVVMHRDNGQERPSCLIASRNVMLVQRFAFTLPQSKREVACARVRNCFVGVNSDGAVLRGNDDCH